MWKRDKLFIQATKARSPNNINRFWTASEHVKNIMREKKSEDIKI